MLRCNRFLGYTKKEAKRQFITWPKVLRCSEAQGLGVPDLKAQELGVQELRREGL